MKTKNRFLMYGIGILTAVLMLAGCMDNSRYSKVQEQLLIHNGTDSTIYIEYGFLRTMHLNDHQLMDSVAPAYTAWYRFEDSQINGLWISEKDFNAYVSQIRIYKLNKKDTIFVAPHYYNTKSAWAYEYGTANYDFDVSVKQNHNDLTILPTMFNQ